MTETELKQRLSADVAGVEAPADLLDRARTGGARRVRRRRFITVGTVALTTAVVAGVTVAAPAVFDHRSDPPVAAIPSASDPYAFLMDGPTRGDLAGDKAYLQQVLAAWHASHSKSLNSGRGIFDHLQGDAKVAWAGNTPGGRAAIVVENSDLRKHANVRLYREGVATLVGYVGDGPDGKPLVVGDDYPEPGSPQQVGFLVGRNMKVALVVLQMPGEPIGLSTQSRSDTDGAANRIYFRLRFRDQVAVVPLSDGQMLTDLRLNRMPGNEFSYLSIVNAGVAPSR
jgi:hypothetical protein